MKTDEFLFQLFAVLLEEAEDNEAHERFSINGHRENISIGYTFPKNNFRIHTIDISAVSRCKNLYNVTVSEEDSRNGNDQNLVAYSVALSDSDVTKLYSLYNDLQMKLIKKKYDKPFEEILMTISPKMLDRALLGGVFEEKK